jgi:hypothetical protein
LNIDYMAKIPAGTEFRFSTSRDVRHRDMAEFIGFAAKLGLEPNFSLPTQPINTGSDELNRHLQETWPTSRAAYFGKEHFRQIGQGLGFETSHSKAFTVVALPVGYSPKGGPGDVIDSSSLGLVVVRRSEIGFPEIPKADRRDSAMQSHNERLHAKVLGDPELRVSAYVMQVAGFIDIAQNSEVLDTFYGAYRQCRTRVAGVALALQSMIDDIQTEI